MTSERVEQWGIGVDDRGMGRHSYAVMENEKVIVECPDLETAQTIVNDHNSYADSKKKIEGLRTVLQKIQDYDNGCECEHDNENCCALVDEFCSRCIAAAALAETERE
jgi:hypothetical protein